MTNLSGYYAVNLHLKITACQLGNRRNIKNSCWNPFTTLIRFVHLQMLSWNTVRHNGPISCVWVNGTPESGETVHRWLSHVLKWPLLLVSNGWLMLSMVDIFIWVSIKARTVNVITLSRKPDFQQGWSVGWPIWGWDYHIVMWPSIQIIPFSISKTLQICLLWKTHVNQFSYQPHCFIYQ